MVGRLDLERYKATIKGLTQFGGRRQGHGPGNTPRLGPGRARRRGTRPPDAVNFDPLKQPDLKLRELDSQPSTPGPREEVYCTNHRKHRLMRGPSSADRVKSRNRFRKKL